MRNYTELQVAIADELARDDLGSQVANWIFLAESYIARKIELIDGEQFTTGTLVVDQPYIDFPEGFKKPIHIEIQSSPLRVLNIVSLDKRSDVLENEPATLPRTMSVIGRRGYLAPVPGTAETYHLFYYGRPPPLSEENPTNDLLDMGPDAILYQSLMYSAPYLGDDERLVTWGVIAKEAIKTLRDEYWDAHFDGGITRIRPDFAPGDGHDQGAIQS